MNGPTKDTPAFSLCRDFGARARLFCVLLSALGAGPACVARTADGHGGETNWLEACRKDPECDAGATQSTNGHDADADAPPEAQLSEAQLQDAFTTPQAAALADTTGSAWRVIEVPAVANDPSIIESPLGWLALSSTTLGGKAITGYRSALYRSDDGVHWQLLPIAGGDEERFWSIAYGNGVYVMTSGAAAMPQFWTSPDAENWTQSEQGVSTTDNYGLIEFVNGKFFALGMRYMGVSDDGVSWSHVPVSNVQGRDVAYGNGQYVMVGSGPMQVSQDAVSWQSVDVPCSLPGACSSDPSGKIFQNYHTAIVFADGRFYTDRLVSSDGLTWEASPWPSLESSPARYTSGWLLGSLVANLQLQAWTPTQEPRPLRVIRPSQFAQTRGGRAVTSIGVNREVPAATVDASFEDGLTCETATCVQIGNRLLLVPPTGQPALADRIPRDADGAPLLNEDCPVSSQLFCDDYAARSGCVCDNEAPPDPESCGDVGKYACDGAFEQTGDEWALDEVAQAGCNCDHVDPDEPATFGETCTTEDNTCADPLLCRALPIEGDLPFFQSICTAGCGADSDCPTWTATGFCAGEVQLSCLDRTCQARTCD